MKIETDDFVNYYAVFICIMMAVSIISSLIADIFIYDWALKDNVVKGTITIAMFVTIIVMYFHYRKSNE